nr:integrase, catalytic region, zinc finger, CCHC-type, peptidase aspartic, catalytic [Tanacetum cinerariifolium]
GRQNRGRGNNARGAGAAGYGGAHNRVENANPSQARQIKCYNCNGMGHIARNRTQPKRPQNSKYFKEKILLMQAQENMVALDEEQLLFIAGRQDNVVDEDVDEPPGQDLALNVDNVFQADEFDYDVDEAPTGQTMFMANLSSADHVYNEASPSYDSDILSEYVKDNAVSVVQSNVSSMPNDAYMMIINEMHEPSALSVFANRKYKVVNASLTAELATYKAHVELYERRAKFELAEREQNIDEQLRIVITDPLSVFANRKHKVVNASLTAELATYKAHVELYERRAKFELAEREQNIDEQLRIVITDPTFTPQKQLTPEQIFWSKDLLKMKEEAPKEQTTASRPIKALTVYPPNTPATLILRVHLDYLIHLKKSVAILREILEEARVEKPLDCSLASACCYTKHSQELVEYLIGTCPTNFNKGDKQIAFTCVTRKKRVTFMNQCETSTNNILTHVKKQTLNKTNEHVIPFRGVKGATAASRSKPRSNIKKDTTLPSKTDMNKVEVHPMKNKYSVKQKNHVDSSISYKRTVIQIVLWYLYSGYSKHMTGDRSRLKNFMKKFIRTVRFGNDHFGAIMGYGDYVIGDSVISRSSSALQSRSLQQGVAAESTIMEDNPLAPVDNDPFVNVFAPEPSSEASSSGDVSLAESTYVTQTHYHLVKWSKDHSLDNVIGNPSRSVSTRKQLAIDALWCLYNSLLSKVEPKNFKSDITEDF